MGNLVLGVIEVRGCPAFLCLMGGSDSSVPDAAGDVTQLTTPKKNRKIRALRDPILSTHVARP